MVRGYLLGPMILATALWIGCGGGTRPSQPNPVGSNTQGNLTIGANSLGFGSVSVGCSKTNSLVLSNGVSGGSSITVTQSSVTGAGFTLSSGPAVPFVLAPGQSATLMISFNPMSAGSASGALSIISDAANSTATVSLSGSGLAPAPGQLAVAPATMNFGSLAVGSSKSQTGTLTTSTADITVKSAAWNGQGYSLSGITFPTKVPANQSTSFTVTFAPQTKGPSSGNISFVSNASNSPNTEMLTGAGAEPVQHSVSLSWSPSTSRVVGYNIYRGTRSGGPYAKLNRSPLRGTNYTDSTVHSGITYYYVATSVGSKKMVESGHSNQTTAVIPTP